jgi:uncharacterized protein (TIGR00290 family)
MRSAGGSNALPPSSGRRWTVSNRRGTAARLEDVTHEVPLLLPLLWVGTRSRLRRGRSGARTIVREPVIISWSGGKDSALTLAALRDDPRLEPAALLTTVTAGYDRVSIHGVRRGLLAAQARAVDLPLHEMWLEPASSNAAYETALAGALAELRERYHVRRIAYGDLFLEDVRRYREARLAALGWSGVFPLWGRPTAALARSFVADGYEARLVCVDTTLLPATFAGRVYNAWLLADLPEHVDPCGERGEFHTFVAAGPGFSSRVAYDVGEVVVREGRFAYCDLVGEEGRKGVDVRRGLRD